MKLKVTCLTAAVLFLILLALDSLIYFTLHRHLMSLEASVVRARAQTVSQELSHSDALYAIPFGMYSINNQLESDLQDGETIVVFGVGEQMVGHAGDLTQAQIASTLFNRNDFSNMEHAIPVHIGHNAYMYAISFIGPRHNPLGVVVLYKNINDTFDSLHTLLTALALGSLGAVALAAGGGYAISAAAARPIDQMIRLVDRIQAGKMNERLPVPRGTDEVARLAATFNQMLDRIERSFQQQAQFVADASHEIRTPLTTIQGYAQLLGRWGKQDPAVLEKALGVIEKESVRLKTLTNDMLTLADMESSQHSLSKTCEINQAISDVLEPYGMLHPEYRLTWNPGEPCHVTMPPEHFGRVLTNLVDNAIKYTPQSGSIEVLAVQSPESITVSVSDTGQGIPEEDLPRIFDRFYRVDKARSRTAGGNGLGLAIVRELVELYNGRIWAESRVGEGTTVHFSLPRAASDPTA